MQVAAISAAPPVTPVQAISFARRSTGRLEVMTEEGDRVVLSYEATRSFSKSGSSWTASDSVDLSLEVQGDLNAREARSIRKLIKQFFRM